MKTIFKKILLPFIPKNYLKRKRIKTGMFREKYLNKEHIKYYDALKKSVHSEDPSHLFNAFHSEFINTKYFSNKWWRNYIKAASNFDESSGELQHDLVKKIYNVELSRVEIRDFIHFYSLSLRTGLLNVGYAFRKQARKAAYQRLINHKSNTLAELKYGIAAYVELNGYADNSNYYDYKSKLDSNFKFLIERLEFIHADNRKDNVIKESDTFFEYIQKKNIAVVGPAKVSNNDAEEIDSYDIVVRCNYKEKGKGIDPIYNGERCNITYLNGAISKYILNEENINWPVNINWVVCKTEDDANNVKEKLIPFYNSKRKPLNSRSLILFDDVLFNGTLNAIPNILLDLLQYNPKSIKVFHADLNLTTGRSKGFESVEWDKEVQEKSRFLIAASRTHEPLTQFNVLKRLWQSDKIFGDSGFNKVMNMSEEEFMSKLQKIYGNVGRILEG